MHSKIIIPFIFLLLLSGISHAATYQWTGNSTAIWTDRANWLPAGSSGGSFPFTVADGPALTGGTFSISRLNVNNTTGPDLVYSTDMGETIYGGDQNGRGLVIGSSSNGTMTMTGGTFSTNPSTAQDVIGHLRGTGTLNINGGTFIGSQAGTTLGWTPYSSIAEGILNVNSGNTTFGQITMAAYSIASKASINLNGGHFSVCDHTGALICQDTRASARSGGNQMAFSSAVPVFFS